MPAMPMPDPFRDALQRVIAKYGRSLVDDAERCEAVLRTVCGEFESEITALMPAVKEKVPASLVSWHDRLPMASLLIWTARSLAQKASQDPATARWAVETCAWLLNMITTADLTTALPAPPKAPEPLEGDATETGRAPMPAPSAAPEAPVVRRYRSRIFSRKAYTIHLKTLALVLAPGILMEFVRMPPGEFLMGSDKSKDRWANDDETPQHIVRLGEYLIGRYPVTNVQYDVFVRATGSRPPEHWPEGRVTPAFEHHPVVNVSWDDAFAFCRWVSEVTRHSIRLPTEAEWEKAARGLEGGLWPWGNEAPDKTRCNFSKQVGGTTPLGAYSPAGDSPFGCTDMAGNVWEWTASLYRPYPFQVHEERKENRSREARVVRGGAWDSGADAIRAARRARADPTTRLYTRGFRCAR